MYIPVNVIAYSFANFNKKKTKRLFNSREEALHDRAVRQAVGFSFVYQWRRLYLEFMNDNDFQLGILFAIFIASLKLDTGHRQHCIVLQFSQHHCKILDLATPTIKSNILVNVKTTEL